MELLPLNALNSLEFEKIVHLFPLGQIIIVNEGLLMYLDTKEKEKLCGIIRAVLKERGGYWITTDIYIKSNFDKTSLNIDKKTSEFLEQHKTEENKFKSFEEAEAFFRSQGFVIEKEANVDSDKLSTLKHLLQGKAEETSAYGSFPKLRKTWRLSIDPSFNI